MSSIFKKTGLTRLATIENVYPETMTVDISFQNDLFGNSLKPGGKELYTAQLPISYLSSGGGFIGGFPAPGTPVSATQAESGHHYIISNFLARDPAAKSTVGASTIKIPRLEEGSIVIQSNPDARMHLSGNRIEIGSDSSHLVVDTYEKTLESTLHSHAILSQSERYFSGTIYRDKNFDTEPKSIGLDPVANTTVSTYSDIARNPARNEKRELIFEYDRDAFVHNNQQELRDYNREKKTIVPGFQSRRELERDTLSLSLVSPNYLMETIKGNVADVYGNILDINRTKLPLGEGKNSIVGIKSTTANQSTNKNIYEEIKRIERKSLAYHFEINARKEVEKSGPPNPSNRDNYARDRSRFFVDIDKEGLFKINVPASSPTGNIPLLTRYENYSTINPNPRSKDPDDVVVNRDAIDILVEAFGDNLPIKLVDENDSLSAPIDRFSSAKSPQYIGHGTLYHDITKTISASTEKAFYVPTEFTPTTALAMGSIKPIKEVVSSKIITSGKNANAGGRSGQMNFDGSLEWNIGANQVDSQSLWIDTEGGILGNIGQDKNGMSLAASLDGDIFLQLGDKDIAKGKVFDLKVANGAGEISVLRFDKYGLSVTTPGRIVYQSTGDMMFRSSARITMDAEDFLINGRKVLLDPGKGPIR